MWISSENRVSAQRLGNALESRLFPSGSSESVGLSVSLLPFHTSKWVVPTKLRSLRLLGRRVTGPDHHPRVNWCISARDQLRAANLPDFTLRRVKSSSWHHHNINQSERQLKDPAWDQRGWWGVTANLFCWPFPHLPHLQGGKERRETTQTGPFGFHRSEVTLLTSSSRHVPWRGKTTAAIAFWVARCRVAQFWPCALLPGAARGENKPAALHVAPAPRHSGTRRCWTHVLLGKQLSASQN